MKNLISIAVLSTALAAPVAVAQTMPPSSPSASGVSAQPQWYAPAGGEIRSSKLIGTAVKNTAGETIGDINEVLLDKDGRVTAVVVGVGGFLGMGEREVAVTFSSLRFALDNTSNATIATINATRDSLKAAPEWKWTTPSGGSGTTGTSTR